MQSMEEKIAQINALYHKSQTQKLTNEELELQKKLRNDYILAVRANLRGQLQNIDVYEKDGTITNLGERRTNKNANKEGN